MVERSRIWRGPCRAPGRLVVPVSHGTPISPISTRPTASATVTWGRRMNVATPAKRGNTVPGTGSNSRFSSDMTSASRYRPQLNKH